MINIETEKDGKINAAICGAPDIDKTYMEAIKEAIKTVKRMGD